MVQVTGNQARLAQAVQNHSARHEAVAIVSSTEVGKRNREEKRLVRIWALPEGFSVQDWHGQTLIQVTRTTDCFDTRRKSWHARQEQVSWYLATCTGTASFFADTIRSHWAVENRLHYVLDETFDEDASRIRRNPGVFACLRQFGSNLLRFNGEKNMRAALYANALNIDRVLAYNGI